MDHKTSKITRSVNRVLTTTIFLLGQLFCSAKDTIEYGFPIQYNGETLVSAGETFEMGFFTPNGMSSEKRYVGIWYKASPDTIVWVANRDNPILPGSDTTGFFGIKDDGNLHVLEHTGGKSLWSTEINETSQSPNLTTAKLTDSGNLILSLPGKKSLWESFKNPSDTFLPGMEMGPDLALTSWRETDDPGTGGFVFKLDDQARETQYSVMNGSVPYWRSGVKFAGSDKILDWILDILSNSTLQMVNGTVKRDYSGRRLAITSDGTVNAYVMVPDGENVLWALIWSQPSGACSVSNACGNFGSCVANNNYDSGMNILVCKCLPGFKPTYPNQWAARDFSGGCTERTRPSGDSFLNLTMMDLKKPESSDYPVSNETECMEDCRENGRCKAFSFSPPEEKVFKRDTDSKPSLCSIWVDTLQGLQEGYGGGRNISVRVASSDLESTKRNCDPCGTNIVPYPLSTGPGCGDQTYFNFHCNHSNTMLTFKVHGGDYQVLRIDPDTRRFLIEVPRLDNCGARNEILGLGQSSPFNVSDWCYGKSRDQSSRVSAGRTRMVEIEWDPPQEPTCGSDSGCEEWPSSSCSRDKKRCLCNTNYRWDGLTLNCTQGDGANSENDVPLQPVEQLPSKKNASLPLIVVPTVLSVALLACTFICFIIVRRRKISKQKNSRRSDQRSKELLKLDTQKNIDHLINTGEFEKKDEGIDVPFISFDSIIEATNSFSEANKLGQGGYGPVYKGVFSGGHEIAVKRLSSVSGQGLEEFKNEVVLIAKLQHRNLVRLRGYCMKGDEKILLYEYMPNRSLDAFIFDDKRVILDWEKRFSIILGIARGLLYLHQDSRL